MPTFAWVATNILSAALGGAVATWVSISIFNDAEPQTDVVIRNLTSLGAVLAGLCGGLAGIGRITSGSRDDLLTGVATLFLVLIGLSVINPGYLFSPLLLFRAPLQGIASLAGGFAAIAVLWTGTSLVATRNESRPANARSGNLIAPLKKLGCGVAVVGCLLPMLAILGDSPAVAWIGSVAVSVGVLVYAASFVADVWVTLSNKAMQRTRDKAGTDGKPKVASR